MTTREDDMWGWRRCARYDLHCQIAMEVWNSRSCVSLSRMDWAGVCARGEACNSTGELSAFQTSLYGLGARTPVSPSLSHARGRPAVSLVMPAALLSSLKASTSYPYFHHPYHNSCRARRNHGPGCLLMLTSNLLHIFRFFLTLLRRY